MQHWWPISFS